VTDSEIPPDALIVRQTDTETWFVERSQLKLLIERIRKRDPGMPIARRDLQTIAKHNRKK
jgi:hypothetical protein